MTDISSLEGLKQRERELEIDAVLIRGRVLEVRAMIEELQRRRGGRPRKPAEVSVMPQRQATDIPNGPHGIPGAIHETPTEESAA